MSKKLENITFTDKSIEYFQKMDEYLLGTDLMLMLLSISPIKGKARMQKQIFLAWKTLFNNQTTDLGFFPYKFGPYSKTITDSTNILQSTGLIKIIPRNAEATTFSITPKGKRIINKKLKDMNINLKKLKEKKTDWDELKIRGLMKFVYRKYPEYTTKTMVPSLKW